MYISRASDISHGCTEAFAGIVWCSWHDLQDLTLCSMCVFISGHQTYDLANTFIRLLPVWLLCISFSTLLCEFIRTITLFPHKKYEFSIDSSFLHNDTVSTVHLCQPVSTYLITLNKTRSRFNEKLISLEVTGECEKVWTFLICTF